MSSPKTKQELVEKLVLFQRAYSQSVLQIGIHGNIYRTDPWEEVFRYEDRYSAAEALVEAGYEHTTHDEGYSTGWWPVPLLRRRKLDEMCSRLADDVETLNEFGSTMPLDGHKLLLDAQTKLASAVASINAASSFLR